MIRSRTRWVAGVGVALLVAGMLVVVPQSASAGSVLRVPAGFATIQEAIGAASDGDDSLRGNRGDDVLNGGPGVDVLHGGPGVNTCSAGEDLTAC